MHGLFFLLEKHTQDTTPLEYSFVCASARIHTHTHIYIWVPVMGCLGRRREFLPFSSYKGAAVRHTHTSPSSVYILVGTIY